MPPTPADRDTTPARATRRYRREFVAAIMVYGALVALGVALLGDASQQWWRFAVALAPVLGLVLVVAAGWRWLRDQDELVRTIVLESLAIAFAAGTVLTFAYGLAQTVGAPRANWMLAILPYGLAWAVTQPIVSRRRGAVGRG